MRIHVGVGVCGCGCVCVCVRRERGLWLFAMFDTRFTIFSFVQGALLLAEAVTVIIATVNHKTTTRNQTDTSKMVTIQMV